jgi:hypothetical protein
MASTTLSVLTPTLAGATITAKTGVASSETLTIQATTAQSALDFRSLFVRVANTSSTAAVTLSLAAGTEYSGIGVGAKSISIATEATVIIGGQTFESARFLSSAGTIVFTQTGAGPTSWEAFQKPRASE